MAEEENQELECNFCSKKRTEVVKLVAGAGVFICDECINLCYDIHFYVLKFYRSYLKYKNLQNKRQYKKIS